jgi:hypothetical protein
MVHVNEETRYVMYEEYGGWCMGRRTCVNYVMYKK